MKKILIIGGGNMGYAIAQGIVNRKVIKKANIIIVEKDQERILYLKRLNFTIIKTPSQALKFYKKNIGIMILAVKPNDIANVLNELKDILQKNVVVVSIAAGIKIKTIASNVSKFQPIARVMPNTPCQIGEGMSVIAFNKNISIKQKNIIFKIFKSIGKTIELSEDKFDLAGSISGSGPAYFCHIIECLVNSGIKLGLQNDIAYKLVLQTGLGTMLLLTKSNLSCPNLRAAVTSKKGITEAALKVLNKASFKDTIYLAIKAAKKRSQELGKMS